MLYGAVLTFLDVLVVINFGKMEKGRSDYAFHCYGEMCNFVYCLLLKTRVSTSLPGIHEWEEYMDVEKVKAFPSIPDDEFLENYELGRLLNEKKTSNFTTFRVRCREFLDCLVVTLLKNPSATSAVSKGIYSFCPELMLEGDNSTAFALFAGLCSILETCGVLASDESKGALDEYSSFIVERRKSHASSKQSATNIDDVVAYLLLDFGFQARHRVFRVFRLCCLFIGMPVRSCPALDFDLSGSALDPRSFYDCLRLVQSYVMSAGYSAQGLFSDQALGSVRKAVSTAGTFFISGGFSMWEDFYRADPDAFSGRYVSLYLAYLDDRRKEFDAEYNARNVANRLSRVQSKVKSPSQVSRCPLPAGSQKEKVSVSQTGSTVAQASKEVSVSWKSSGKGAANSRKGQSTESISSSAESGVTPKKKKKSGKRNVDPDVKHRLSKPLGR